MKIIYNNFLLIILLTITLFGCATPYQKLSFSGGYSETKLGKNIFNISFEGNGYTNKNKVIDFALLRSAEIAIENGFNFFSIAESYNEKKHDLYTTPTYTNTIGVKPYNYGTYTTGGQTYLSEKSSTINTIICFEKMPKNSSLIVYEAKFIIDSIKNKYQIY